MSRFQQQKLFQLPPERTPPHRQTFEEFGNRADTMWHGTEYNRFPEVEMMTNEDKIHPDFKRQGFHVGTFSAAEHRVTGTRGRRGGYLFPVTLQSKMKNTPDNPIRDQGMDWTTRQHRSYYLNTFEGEKEVNWMAPTQRVGGAIRSPRTPDRGTVGNISAVVPTPEDKHVRTFVGHARAAQEQGRMLGGHAAYWLEQSRHGVEPSVTVGHREAGWRAKNFPEQTHTQGELFYGGFTGKNHWMDDPDAPQALKDLPAAAQPNPSALPSAPPLAPSQNLVKPTMQMAKPRVKRTSAFNEGLSHGKPIPGNVLKGTLGEPQPAGGL